MSRERGEERPTSGSVTRIATQRKNPDRVSIHLDGAFAIGVHRDVLLEFPLRRGEVLDEAGLRQLEAADERIRARKRALDLLAYRSRTEQELRDRLTRDGFSEQSVAEAVGRMRELGYVDDASFASDYAAARLRTRGYGRRRLVAELRKRGVGPALAEQAVDDAIGDGSEEIEHAREFARKRLRRLQSEPDARKRRKKLYDALARRGFGADVIRKVADEVLGAIS